MHFTAAESSRLNCLARNKAISALKEIGSTIITNYPPLNSWEPVGEGLAWM